MVEDQDTPSKAFQRMKDIFHQEAFSDIQNVNSKLRTYGLFKISSGYEKYLSDIRPIDVRTVLTKLRISNHPLMIEKGRHVGIHSNLRFCPFCPTEVEDEEHVLMQCKPFANLRNDLFGKIKKL